MTAVRQAVSAQDTCLSAFLWEPSGLASHGGIPHAIPAPGEAEPAIVTEPEEVAEVLRASEQGGATASAPAPAAGFPSAEAEVLGSQLQDGQEPALPQTQQALCDTVGRVVSAVISPSQEVPEPLDEETPDGYTPGPSYIMLVCPSHHPERIEHKSAVNKACPKPEGPVREYEPPDQPPGLPPGFKLVYRYRRTCGTPYLNYQCWCKCGNMLRIDRWQKVDGIVKRHVEHNPDLKGVTVTSFNFRPAGTPPQRIAPYSNAGGAAPVAQSEHGRQAMPRPVKKRRTGGSGCGGIAIGTYLNGLAALTETTVPVFVRDPVNKTVTHGVMRLPSKNVECGCQLCKDTNAIISPNLFEVHGGRTNSKKWKDSIRMIPKNTQEHDAGSQPHEPNSGNSVDDSGSEMDDFYVEKAQPLQSTAETPMPAHEPEADIRTTSHCPELPETGAEPHGDLPPPPQYGGMSSIDYFCNLDHVAGPSAADPGPQYAGTEDAGESTDHDSASTQPLTIDDSDDKPDAESCAPPCP
mmetsp:Transcript_28950/g.75044  ORF Transcript_28950/g.75044 Transcript_28950/m.75044 type:complete len:521 (+) Transcript_28950:249-1811(+)